MTVERVHLIAGDEADRAAQGIAVVLAEAFRVETQRIRAIEEETLALLGRDEFHAVLVRVDGEPAATARRTTFAGASYLSSIGTRPAFRGRGLGRIATEVALQDAVAAGQPLDLPRGLRRQRRRPPDVRVARVRRCSAGRRRTCCSRCRTDRRRGPTGRRRRGRSELSWTWPVVARIWRRSTSSGPWPSSALPGEPLADDPLLGGAGRARPPADGSPIAILEPFTEGRLAASLARIGEGEAGLYVAPPGGSTRARELADRGPRRPPDGPFGMSALLVPARLLGQVRTSSSSSRQRLPSTDDRAAGA